MSQHFCGLNQPFKPGLTPVRASAVCQLPHHESLWVTHLDVPHCEWFPKVLMVRCLMCVTSASGGVRASFTQVSQWLGTVFVGFPSKFLVCHASWMTKWHILPCLPVFCWNLADKMHACCDAPKVCGRAVHHPPAFQENPQTSSMSNIICCLCLSSPRLKAFINYVQLLSTFVVITDHFSLFQTISGHFQAFSPIKSDKIW